jgi:oligopeptide/dipeptide ABC transporter ATP-binding protein
MTSLNPVFTIGEQLLEAIGLNGIASRREAEARAIAALHEVGISEPAQRLRQYPHEFSGGMRQRVMIAMALAGHPKLLLADEPTTALDVTVQAQILRLLREIQQRRGMGIMLITHDLGIVAEHADVGCVVFAGRVMEYASVSTLFARPRHPYTRALLECRPKLHDRPRRLMTVAHAMSSVNQIGIESGASAFLPWWSARAPENRAREYCLMEVEPNHWVACCASAQHEITNRIPQIEPEQGVPSSLSIA